MLKVKLKEKNLNIWDQYTTTQHKKKTYDIHFSKQLNIKK